MDLEETRYLALYEFEDEYGAATLIQNVEDDESEDLACMDPGDKERAEYNIKTILADHPEWSNKLIVEKAYYSADYDLMFDVVEVVEKYLKD